MPVITYVRGASAPRRVFLALPAGSGEITAPCVASLFEGQAVLAAAGYGVDLCIEAGNCHVDDARNSLVRQFMQTDCAQVVFIDADVGFRAEDLLRLVDHDADVVAGVYPKKQDDEDFPVYVHGDLWADPAGLVQVEGAPTGFMKIRRAVIEQLSEGAVKFIGSAGDPVPYAIIFERTIADGRRWSGDYAFCRKWAALGGKIHVDPEMTFSHTGPKTWHGTLGAFWKRKHGVDAAEKRAAFDRAVQALKDGTPEPEDFVALSQGWDNPWAASPGLLAAAYRCAAGRVLECGSGLTTLVMATKAEVTSLEHDPVWAAYTRAMLERYGLSADIQCRPLKDGWYDAAPGAADVLVVDGPPRTISDRLKVFDHASAPLIIWDDYDGCELPGSVEVIDGEKAFAIARR